MRLIQCHGFGRHEVFDLPEPMRKKLRTNNLEEGTMGRCEFTNKSLALSKSILTRLSTFE